MNTDERRRKIEVGRQRLALFRKKKEKTSSVATISSPHLIQDTFNLVDSTMLSDKEMDDSECNKENKGAEMLPATDHIAQFMTEYSQKINKYQEALEERDNMIHQLSDRLASTLETQHTIQKEAMLQAESLAKEINILKQQLQEASEVLSHQKSKNGVSAHQLLESRNRAILLEHQSSQKNMAIKKLSEEVAVLKKRVSEASHENREFNSCLTLDQGTETEVFLWDGDKKQTKDAVTSCRIGETHPPMNKVDACFTERYAKVAVLKKSVSESSCEIRQFDSCLTLDQGMETELFLWDGNKRQTKDAMTSCRMAEIQPPFNNVDAWIREETNEKSSDAVRSDSLPSSDVTTCAFISMSRTEIGVQVGEHDFNPSKFVYSTFGDTHSIKPLAEFADEPICSFSVQQVEDDGQLRMYVNNSRAEGSSGFPIALPRNDSYLRSTAKGTSDVCRKSPDTVLQRLECLQLVIEVVESSLNIVKQAISKYVLGSHTVTNTVKYNFLPVSEKLEPDARQRTDVCNVDSATSEHSSTCSSSGNELNLNTFLCQDLSAEILRRYNMPNKLSRVSEFLKNELTNCFSEYSMSIEDNEEITASINEPNSALQEGDNITLAPFMAPTDLQFNAQNQLAQTSDVNIMLYKKSIETGIQHFKMLGDSLSKPSNPVELKNAGSDKYSESDLNSEKLPLSSTSLLSLSDIDNRIGRGDAMWDMGLNDFGIAAGDVHDDQNRRKSVGMQSAATESGDSTAAAYEMFSEMFSDSHRDQSLNETREIQKTFDSHAEPKLYDSHETRAKSSPGSIVIHEKPETVGGSEQLTHHLKENHTRELKCFLEECLEEKRQLGERTTDLESVKLELETNAKEFARLLAEKESVCAGFAVQIQSFTDAHDEQLLSLQSELNQRNIEKLEMLTKIKDLQDALIQAGKKSVESLESKAGVESDLSTNHARKDTFDILHEEKMQMEKKYQLSLEQVKIEHEDQLSEIHENFMVCLEKEKQKVIEEHSEMLIQKDLHHVEEMNTWQREHVELLAEKHRLVEKHQTDFDTIVKRHHVVLEKLYSQCQAYILEARVKIERGETSDGVPSSSAIFDDLSKAFENEVTVLLQQNIYGHRHEEEDTHDVSLDQRCPDTDGDLKEIVDSPLQVCVTLKETSELEVKTGVPNKEPTVEMAVSDHEQIQLFMSEEINKIQKDFKEGMAVLQSVNMQLGDELGIVRSKIRMLEEINTNLKHQLKQKDETLDPADQSQLQLDNTSVRRSVNSSQIPTSEIRSWRVHAAQTNSRLLHVLSHLVKTFLDIEHDINWHLMQYGLISPNADSGAQHDDDTVQSIGSREDFTALSVGESPNLDLTEDGPDLTPRAWDLFNSVGTYDAEIEGEDVVIGASRRLRSAVDQVLFYLTRAIENLQNRDLKALLKRNEELSQDLQEESHGKDAFQIDLVNAESSIRKLETEKQKLENTCAHLTEQKEALVRELEITKGKLKVVEEDREVAYEEQQHLIEQRDLLASGLGDPEQLSAGTDRVRSHSEPLVHEDPELLQANTTLSSEKRSIQRHFSKERQSFIDRLSHLEVSYEEESVQKEEILEQKKREVEDLKAQMEAMEKHLQSNRKFIEEQAQEREQEREEYLKEVSKLREIVREKERIQNNEEQLNKEVENLESLLKAKIEDHKTSMAKKEELDRELRQSFDRVNDLKDIIHVLEKQLELKTRTEGDLKKELADLQRSLSAQEKQVQDVPKDEEQRFIVSCNQESIEQIQDLEEQLVSKTQEVERLSQCEDLLKELRAQLHFLQAKVEQKINQIEAAVYLPSMCASPAPSDDTSHSESHDGELQVILGEVGCGELSPRSVHWIEMRSLENKVSKLLHIDEELIKRNKDMELQIRKFKYDEKEYQIERTTLHKQSTEYLLQISALKSCLEEMRHKSAVQTDSGLAKELASAREACCREKEQREKVQTDLHEATCRWQELKEKLDRANFFIKRLKDSENEKKRSQVDNSSQTEPEISWDGQRDIPSILKHVIEEKNKHIDFLNSQLKQLNKAPDEQKQKSFSDFLMSGSCSDEQTHNPDLGKNILDLEEKLQHQRNQCNQKAILITFLTEQVEKLKSEIFDLEEEMKKTQEQAEADQVHVRTLLEEVGSLTNYQKRLERDFDEVQDMMQKKERELATLHEESESQLRLEAENETLQQMLSDQKLVEKELKEEVNNFRKSLDEMAKEYAEKEDRWVMRLDEAMAEQENLKKQLKIIRTRMKFPVANENIFIQQVWRHIHDAAATLKGQADLFELFDQMTLYLLRKLATFISDHVKSYYMKEMHSHENNWKEQLAKEEQKYNDMSRQMASYRTQCQVYEKEREGFETQHRLNLKASQAVMTEVFKEQLERTSSEKDNYWQRKLDMTLKFEKESFQNLLTAEREMLQKELVELKQTLNNATKEKDSLLSQHKKDLSKLQNWMTANHEREKNKLRVESQDMVINIENDLATTFSHLKGTLKSSYESQIQELQKIVNCGLEGIKEHLQAKHKKELNSLHSLFNIHFKDELEKLRKLHHEELKQFKGCEEDTLEEMFNRLFGIYEITLKTIQMECEQQLACRMQSTFASHQTELQNLQQAFEVKFFEEKQKIFTSGEAEILAVNVGERKHEKESLAIPESHKHLTSDKERRVDDSQKIEIEKLKLQEVHEKDINSIKEDYELQREMLLESHGREMKLLEANWQKKLEIENMKSKLAHEREICSLKENYNSKLHEMKAALSKTHKEQLEQLKQAYSIELQKARDALQELMSVQKKSPRMEGHMSLSRTQILVEEASDTSGSIGSAGLRSSYTDALPLHVKLLADEVYKSSIDVVRLTKEYHARLAAALDENFQLREEKISIFNKLLILYEMDENSDMGKVMDYVVEELLEGRASYEEMKSYNRKMRDLVAVLQKEVQDFQKLFFDVQEKSLKGTDSTCDSQIDISLRNQRSLILQIKDVVDLTRAVLNWMEKNRHGKAPNMEYSRGSEDDFKEISFKRKRSTSTSSPGIEHFRGGDSSTSLALQTSFMADATSPSPRPRKSDAHQLKHNRSYICQQCTSWQNTLVEEKRRWSDEKSVLQRSIQTLENNWTIMIGKLRELTKEKFDDSAQASGTMHDFWFVKYKRAESYRKSLVFQKRYLLQVLGGFCATERITLAALTHIGVFISTNLESPDTTVEEKHLTGSSRFRAVVFGVLSIIRLKSLMNRFKAKASARTRRFNDEVAEETVQVPLYARSRVPSHSSASSKHSGSSHEFSTEFGARKKGSSRKSREGNQSRSQQRVELHEFVDRLENLHQRLGLGNLDKS